MILKTGMVLRSLDHDTKYRVLGPYWDMTGAWRCSYYPGYADIGWLSEDDKTLVLCPDTLQDKEMQAYEEDPTRKYRDENLRRMFKPE